MRTDSERMGDMSLTDVPAQDFSDLYLSDHECLKTRRRTREWTIPVLKLCGLDTGRVLSAGCGNGMDVLELRENGFEAAGFDLYPPKIRSASWIAVSKANAIPFETGSFDAAICLEVIEHIPRADRLGTAQELLRVVRHGGLIVVATPNRYFPFDEHATWLRIHSPFHDDTLSSKELETLFGRKARTLVWKGYFQFERFGALGRVMGKAMTSFDNERLHRSALNPHLFLAFRR